MCQPRPLFRLFSLFSIQHYNSTTNQCEKYPPSIRHRDSNSQPSDYQFPPLTTRPGLPPKLARLCRAFFGVNSTPLLLSNSTWTNPNCYIRFYLFLDTSKSFSKWYWNEIFMLQPTLIMIRRLEPSPPLDNYYQPRLDQNKDGCQLDKRFRISQRGKSCKIESKFTQQQHLTTNAVYLGST